MNRADTVHDRRPEYGRMSDSSPLFCKSDSPADVLAPAQAYPSGKTDTLRRKALSPLRSPPRKKGATDDFRASIILCSVAFIIIHIFHLSTDEKKKRKSLSLLCFFDQSWTKMLYILPKKNAMKRKKIEWIYIKWISRGSERLLLPRRGRAAGGGQWNAKLLLPRRPRQD